MGRYEYIDEVQKFNPYHDELGRFTTPDGATFFTIATKDPTKQHYADKAKLREQKRQVAAQEVKVEESRKEFEHLLENGTGDSVKAAQAKLKQEIARLDEIRKPIPGVKYGDKPLNPTGDPESIGGAKRGKPMEREQANGGHVNPDFEKVPGSTTNCQSCVVAYEARLRGYNVKAKPNYNNPSARALSHAANRAWIDPETGEPPKIMRNDPAKVKNVTQAQKWIEETVKPGERYTFSHKWKGDQRSGHIISVDRDKSGNLRLYDPQDGRTYQGEDIKRYMSRTRVVSSVYGSKYGVGQLTRVDNMRINPEYANGIMEGIK